MEQKRFQLGMHTYTLHLCGLGESWGFGGPYAYERTISIEQLIDLAVELQLDGLHVTNNDLESLEPEHLKRIGALAREKGLYLELNTAFDSESDPRINSSVAEALKHAHLLGADLVKYSLDIRRPHPLYGSCMHPLVMKQLITRYEEFHKNIPLMEQYGIEIAIENHCETYADEVLWLVKQLDHPLIGCCVDTINSFPVLEAPETCIKKMAPYAKCVHFCDNKIVIDPDGTHFIGTAIGEGDIDGRKVLRYLAEHSPLKRITFEVEYPLGTDSIEEARKKEMERCRKSVTFLREELGVGWKGRAAE